LREQEALRQKLQSEQELLSAYQSKQNSQLIAQHEKETNDLTEKVSVRRALLEQKVELSLIYKWQSYICIHISFFFNIRSQGELQSQMAGMLIGIF